MPISVGCPGCSKRFRAPDSAAGKTTKCPGCGGRIVIPTPTPSPDDDDDYKLVEPERPPLKPANLSPPLPAAAQPAQPSLGAAVTQAVSALPPAPAAAALAPGAASPAVKWVPPTRSTTPDWLRHLHWLLALAMIPLAVSVLMKDESREELNARVVESLAEARGVSPESTAPDPNSTASPNNASPAADPQATSSPDHGVQTMEDESDDEEEGGGLESLLLHLPGHKLKGAFLARDTWLHWIFAIVAIACFMTFFLLLASDGCAKPLHLLGVGAFTATGGIMLLLGVQFLAGIAPHVRLGRGGIIMLVVLILMLIGFSYSAATNPEVGFVGSFVGFTLGVGLCEELCKALPLLGYYRNENQQSWRGAFLWGMASGAGFGVSEGIMYSQDYYNGVSGPGIYIVRFVSCVALHAIWAGSVGITIQQNQHLLQEEQEEWWSYLLVVLRLIAIPMVLHGLYDTLLKKDMNFLALLTAGASFGYLAYVVGHLRRSDDEDERAQYVATYIRSKAQAARPGAAIP